MAHLGAVIHRIQNITDQNFWEELSEELMLPTTGFETKFLVKESAGTRVENEDESPSKCSSKIQLSDVVCFTR